MGGKWSGDGFGKPHFQIVAVIPSFLIEAPPKRRKARGDLSPFQFLRNKTLYYPSVVA